MTTDLTRWTAGLAGDRDPAQPLLTLLTRDSRVELSGATVANWVAKNANLLVDGLGAPASVGLLLPLHWHLPCLLLAGVTAGATVVVADGPQHLAGCDVAFTTADQAGAALDAGVDEVMVVSTHPLGAAGPPVPPPLGDHARDVPGHGDRWTGPSATSWDITAGGRPVAPSDTGTGPQDRVLVTGGVTDVAPLAAVLGSLRDGAGLLLSPRAEQVDLAAAVGVERLTACIGTDVAGLRRLDA
ncbi:MAG: TIGR03089 family protein [Actinomycetes bacterium]